MGKTVVLPNGLTVHLIEDHWEPVVFGTVVFRVGSAHEPPEQAGSAHLLEHMLFAGTDRLGTLDWESERPYLDELADLYEELADTDDLSNIELIESAIAQAHAAADVPAVPDEYGRVMAELGISKYNARTTPDATQYFATFPSHLLEPWIRLEGERLSFPVMRGFTNERRVVLEEKRLRSGHSDSDAIGSVRAQLFGRHPYARSVGGTEQGLAASTPASLEELHDTHYVASNAALILVGDFQTPEVLEWIESSFGTWPTRKPPLRRPPPIQEHRGVQRVQGWGEDRKRWSMTWQLSDPQPGDAQVLAVIGSVLSHRNRRSPATQRLIELSGSTQMLAQAGMFSVAAQCGPGRQRRCESSVLRLLDELAEDGLTQAEGDAARIAAVIARLKALEKHEAQGLALAQAFARHEDLDAAYQRIKDLRGVTTEQILDVLSRHIGRDYVVRGAEGTRPPRLAKSRADTATTTDVAQDEWSLFGAGILALEQPPIRNLALEAGRDFTSLDGGRVVSIWNPRNELFSVKLSWPLGWAQEPMLCEAVHRWQAGLDARESEAWAWLHARGVKARATCSSDATLVTIEGLDPDAPDALRWVLGQLRLGASADTVPKWRIQTDEARRRAFVPMAAQELLLYGEQSRYLTRFPRAADRLEATTADLRPLIQDLALTAPTITSFGGEDAATVAAMLTDEESIEGEPKPPLVERDTFRILWIDSPPRLASDVVSLTLRRAGQKGMGAVTPLASIASQGLGGRGGLLVDQLRTGSGLAYGSSGWVSAGGPEQRAVTEVRFRSSDGDAAIDTLEEVLRFLSDPYVFEDRFEDLKEARRAKKRNHYVRLRHRGSYVRGLDKGIGDRREVRDQALRDATWEEFIAFWAAESEFPSTVLIHGSLSAQQITRLEAIAPVDRLSVDDLYPAL